MFKLRLFQRINRIDNPWKNHLAVEFDRPLKYKSLKNAERYMTVFLFGSDRKSYHSADGVGLLWKRIWRPFWKFTTKKIDR